MTDEYSLAELENVTSNRVVKRVAVDPTRAAHPGDFPDPFVLESDGRWYAFATGGIDAEGRALRLLVSDDLLTWSRATGPLVPPEGTAELSFWAPEVALGADGKFYMYFSCGRESAQQHELRVAVADRVEGPYVALAAPLVDPAMHRFVIDPHPFQDDDGQWWLFYARNFTEVGAEEPAKMHAGTGLVCDRLLAMTRLAGEERVVLRARHDWTLFEAGRFLECYGRSFNWHTLEGPFVLKRNGRYVLMFSGAAYTSDDYGVDYAFARRVDGPYSEESASGPRLLSSAILGVAGPGHHSITHGPDGTDWVAFHAWDRSRECRELHISRLGWTSGGAPVLPT